MIALFGFRQKCRQFSDIFDCVNCTASDYGVIAVGFPDPSKWDENMVKEFFKQNTYKNEKLIQVEDVIPL